MGGLPPEGALNYQTSSLLLVTLKMNYNRKYCNAIKSHIILYINVYLYTDKDKGTLAERLV